MEEDNEDLDEEDGEDDNDDAEEDNMEDEDNEEVEDEQEEEAGGREGGSQKRRSPACAEEERRERGGSAQPAAKKMRTSTEAGEGEGNVTKGAGDTSQGVGVLQQQTLQSLQVCMRPACLYLCLSLSSWVSDLLYSAHTTRSLSHTHPDVAKPATAA